MMKSMIAENGVTFKELEKNIYLWICEIGGQFTAEFLERYDRMLMEERDHGIILPGVCIKGEWDDRPEYQCDGSMECDLEARGEGV